MRVPYRRECSVDYSVQLNCSACYFPRLYAFSSVIAFIKCILNLLRIFLESSSSGQRLLLPAQDIAMPLSRECSLHTPTITSSSVRWQLIKLTTFQDLISVQYQTEEQNVRAVEARYLALQNETWRVLSNWLNPLDKDALFWWQVTGSALAIMLLEAGYDIHSQYQALLFHYHFIILRLGPRPNSDGSPNNWKSYMTDDFSPLEYSWSWGSNGAAPKVRYSIEAIGPHAGHAIDPFNQEMALQLVSQLQSSFPDIDWRMFDYFLKALIPCGRAADGDDPHEFQGHGSSTFLGFELQRGGKIAFKTYLAPIKATRSERSPMDVATAAIQTLISKDLRLQAYGQVLDFMAHDHEGRSLEFLGLAVDCVHPSKSRLKLYMRSPHTSFESVRACMTLGGAVCPSGTLKCLEELWELWKLVIGLADGISPREELPLNEHLTSGVLYNFDIKSGSLFPEPKIYIPVRHYARDDLSIAKGLAMFLAKRGSDQFVDAYLRMLRGICVHRPLESTCGLQTYVACSFNAESISITSYMSPEIYYPGRQF